MKSCSNEFHYRIDFQPETDIAAIRKRVLRRLEEQIGKFVTDGLIVWTKNGGLHETVLQGEILPRQGSVEVQYDMQAVKYCNIII